MEVKELEQTLFFCPLFPSPQQMGVKAQVETSLYVMKEVISPLRLQGFRAILYIACVVGLGV